jgi:hypothetical protein
MRNLLSFRPVHRPTATGEEAKRPPLLRSKDLVVQAWNFLSPTVASGSSLDGVRQQMLETTIFRFYWWSLSHPRPARLLDIFKGLEDFLYGGYCITVSGAAWSNYFRNLSLSADAFSLLSLTRGKIGHPSVFDMALLYSAVLTCLTLLWLFFILPCICQE